MQFRSMRASASFCPDPTVLDRVTSNTGQEVYIINPRKLVAWRVSLLQGPH